MQRSVSRVSTKANLAQNGLATGMRGKNADTLTYRGPDLSERDDTRKLAGCVDKFCAKKIAAGLVPANFNSCDEVFLLHLLVFHYLV